MPHENTSGKGVLAELKLRKGIAFLVLLGSMLAAGAAQAATTTGEPAGNFTRTVYYYRMPVHYGWNVYQLIFRLPYVAPAPAPAPVPAPVPAPAPQPSPASAQQPAPAPGASQADQYERQVLDLVNARRAEAGMAPLAWDARLAALARAKSQDMRDNNYFGHQSPTLGSAFDMMQRAGVKYRYAAENLAAGQRTPQAVVEAWMNSSGHRANIMNPKFTKLGVGFAAGGSYGTYWTQMFIGE